MTDAPTDDLDGFLETLRDDVRKIKSMASNTATSEDIRRNRIPANIATSDDLKNLERAVSQTIQSVSSNLRQEIHTQHRWRKPALVVLVVLVALLGGFTGGAVYTRSGLNMASEAGCIYFGGTWGQRQDGSFMCWKEIP